MKNLDIIKALILVCSFLNKHPEFAKTRKESIREINSFFQGCAKELGVTLEEIYENSSLLKKVVETVEKYLKNNNETNFSINEEDIYTAFSLTDWLKIIRFYRTQGMYEKADLLVENYIYYIQLEEDKSEGYIYLIAEHGVIKAYRQQIKTAIHRGNTALELALSLPGENSNIIAKVYLCLSIIYQACQNDNLSIEQLKKALELKNNISKDILFKLHNNLTSIYLNKSRGVIKEYIEEAKSFIKQADSLESNNSDYYEVAMYYCNKGILKMYDEEIDAGIKDLKTAKNILVELTRDNDFVFAGLLETIGKAYKKKGDVEDNIEQIKSYREAQKNLENSLELHISLTGGFDLYHIEILLSLAKVLRSGKQYSTAKEKLDNALNIVDILESEYSKSNNIIFTNLLVKVRELKSKIITNQIDIARFEQIKL